MEARPAQRLRGSAPSAVRGIAPSAARGSAPSAARGRAPSAAASRGGAPSAAGGRRSAYFTSSQYKATSESSARWSRPPCPEPCMERNCAASCHQSRIVMSWDRAVRLGCYAKKNCAFGNSSFRNGSTRWAGQSPPIDHTPRRPPRSPDAVVSGAAQRLQQ